MRRTSTLLFLLALSTVPCSATVYYVKINGNNAAAGTSTATAFRTIQHALDVAAPGATIRVSAGTYKERLYWPTSGTAQAPITLTSNNGAVVFLDGSNGGTNTAQNALIAIGDKSHLRIRGLRLRNNYRNGAMGIFITGSGSDVRIEECHVSGIGWSTDATLLPTPAQNANPIVVVGTAASPLDSVYITGNRVFDCITGYSEGIAINGNVTHFRVENNVVHDITNIGIVLAGHYAWTGAPAEVNQARQGVVRMNTVYRCISHVATSAGIYVDGGRDIDIARNRCYLNGAGLSVGCENPGFTTDNIVVRSNLVYNNHNAGIYFGSNQSTSQVVNSTVRHNTFNRDYRDGGYGTEIALANSINCTIADNILVARTDSCLAIGLFGYTATGLVTDHNLYWRTPGNTGFLFGNVTAGTNALFADPLFVNSANGDLHLAIGSPAIDAGDPAFTGAPGERDFDGEARVFNGVCDIGADESTLPTTRSLAEAGTRVCVGTPSGITVWNDNANAQVIARSSGAAIVQCLVFDDAGRAVAHLSGNDAQLLLSTATWPSGIYVIAVADANGAWTRERVAVAHP